MKKIIKIMMAAVLLIILYSLCAFSSTVTRSIPNVRMSFSTSGIDFSNPLEETPDSYIKVPDNQYYELDSAEWMEPSYPRGVSLCDLSAILPPYVVETMRAAIADFNRKLSGFAIADAVLTAPETRSSSPVRIIRDENFESSVKGLYPCGEGAGYAGGILSAAVDGIKVAMKIVEKYR